MSDEYPKVIHTGGINVTVTSAEEEAFWQNPPAPPVAEAVEAVSDAPEATAELEEAPEPKKKAAPKLGDKKK